MSSASPVLMKPTALLINIGRAAIVDEAALYEALRGSQLGGAALDVWWQRWSRSTRSGALALSVP